MKTLKYVLHLLVISLMAIIPASAQPETITFTERWSLDRVTSAIWSSTGDRIAVVGVEGELNIYEMRSQMLLHRLAEPNTNSFLMSRFDLAWSPDGHFLAGRMNFSDELRVWDTISGQILYTLPWGGSPLAFSPDGKVLSGYTNHAQIQTWDAATGEAQTTYLQSKRSPSMATVFAWAPHGDALLFNDDNNHLSLFDLTTQTIRFGFSVEDSPLRQAGWTPDGRYIFIMDRGFTLHRWDAANGTPLETFFVGGGMVSFSPDGRYFAANYHSFPYDENAPPWNVVYIYNAQTFDRVGHIDHPDVDDYITWLAWSPDGEHLATVTANSGILRVWQGVLP